MIEATIHYCGLSHERRTLPTVPPTGSYIYGPGETRNLWKVGEVVFYGEAVAVFCQEVSTGLIRDLETAWGRGVSFSS
jgi:hypothetical protein